MYKIKGKNYSVNIGCDGHSVTVEGGSFGEITLKKAPLFTARIKNVDNGESVEITSAEPCRDVRVTEYGHVKTFSFIDPRDIPQLSVSVRAVYDELGISWSVDVFNDNSKWSVMEVTYPTPVVASDKFDLFVPDMCGFVVEEAGKSDYAYSRRYPGGFLVMQYFAAYGERDGVYIGIEDGRGAVKRFDISANEGKAEIKASFYGIGASKGANSFSLSGQSRWQYIKGDWYDATKLYSKFVKAHADWLPEIEADGRADTPKRFKEIPFWICDYIPNIPSQGDNKPMGLSAGSDIFDEGYWIEAVLKLQEELDVPIAYHVYNWHKIPFNIEYPHFLPAKDEFIEGAKKLREKPIYILPYINAGSWEIHDDEMGHPVNFENTGSRGAVKNEDGGFVIETYPQKTVNGEISHLANMCPSSKEWHTEINGLVREMEKTLPIDGIYFDQIGAIQASPCFDPDHGHTVGGGDQWAGGYQRMMARINAEKPRDSFYFTENNAENFTKSYDGFLTWMWLRNDQVPAFPMIYAGYIEMVGRCTIGKKKEDTEFFKFSVAESLLYGQQLGWCKADVVYNEKRLPFLKKMVRLRYKYTELFHCSELMRPPRVTGSIPPKFTPPALNRQTKDIKMEQILSGAWRYKNGEKLVIFCINISEENGKFTLTLPADEYGLENYELPTDFHITGNTCTISGNIPAEDFLVWELKIKK